MERDDDFVRRIAPTSSAGRATEIRNVATSQGAVLVSFLGQIPTYSAFELSASDVATYLGPVSENAASVAYAGFRASALEAFSRWGVHAGITFREAFPGETAQIRIGVSAQPLGIGGISIPLAGARTDIYLNLTRYPDLAAMSVGTRSFQTFLHEVGHMLGLAHPNGNNEDAARKKGSTPALLALDSFSYTTMAYPRESVFGASTTPFVVAPMIYDIEGIRELYGRVDYSGPATFTFPTRNPDDYKDFPGTATVT